MTGRISEITQLNTIGVVHDIEANQIYHVQLSLDGDLPWLLAKLGKRSHNFTEAFSAFCLCPLTSLTNFDIKDHQFLTSDIASMLTHTSPGAAYHNLEHQDFQCPAAACTWGEGKGRLVTAESKEGFKLQLAALASDRKRAAVKAALKKFARAHHGFNFVTPCLFKFEMICPDPLHAYLN
eukprot:4672515-Pleurochrysis_carterae.AAC.1